jgi:type I restriction enzyme M protein
MPAFQQQCCCLQKVERQKKSGSMMEHDSYSLDDNFQQKRTQRLAELQKQIAPLKKDRLKHHAIIHRLRFEEVVSKEPDNAGTARENAEAELAELQSRIAPSQTEINQLTRQFWVTKDQVKANKYDLSASRYRQVEQDENFYEKPKVTLKRLRQLESVATGEVDALLGMMAKS